MGLKQPHTSLCGKTGALSPFVSQPYTVYRWISRAEKPFGDLTIDVYR